MNGSRFVVGLVALTLIAGAGSSKSAVAPKISEVEAVKAANAGFYTALSTRDMAAMMEVWSPTSEVRHIGPRNQEVNVGLEAIRKNIQGAFNAFPELKVTPEQVQVRVVGTVAWVSAIENAARRNKAGEASTSSHFATSIFERQGGKWMMVYHHASMIPR